MTSAAKSLAELTGDRAYDEMDDGLRASITYEQWLWLSDAEKARFMRNATEPESFIDGV